MEESKEGLVEIELDLPIETIKWLEEHSKFLGITVNDLLVNILEEELKNELY